MWTIFWNNNYFGDIKQKAIETKYKVRLIILKLSQGNGTGICNLFWNWIRSLVLVYNFTQRRGIIFAIFWVGIFLL